MNKLNPRQMDPFQVAELLSRLCHDESLEFAKRYAERFGEPDLKKPNSKNSKAFIVYSLLNELQKLGVSLERFANASNATGMQDRSDTDTTDFFWDSLADEFGLWRRKLSEGLVLLINFSRTNTSDYFYHFLLLKRSELNDGRRCEKKTFFEIKSNQDRIRAQKLRRRIRKFEEGFSDLSRCWYRQELNDGQPKTINHKDALKLALEIAESDERSCLAYTYAVGYSELSIGLHLSFLRSKRRVSKIDFGTHLAHLIRLSQNILDRCYSLVNIQVSELIKSSREFARSQIDREPVKNLLTIGTHVIVCGPKMGVIKESKLSQFGYPSYLIRIMYDARKPNEPVDEPPDWYTMDEVPIRIPEHQVESIKNGIANRQFAKKGKPIPDAELLRSRLRTEEFDSATKKLIEKMIQVLDTAPFEDE